MKLNFKFFEILNFLEILNFWKFFIYRNFKFLEIFLNLINFKLI